MPAPWGMVWRSSSRSAAAESAWWTWAGTASNRAMELIRSHLRGLELQQQFDIAMDEEVADPVDIDRAAKASLAIRLPVMGVVARYDFAGLDATLNNLKGEPIHTWPPARTGRSHSSAWWARAATA